MHRAPKSPAHPPQLRVNKYRRCIKHRHCMRMRQARCRTLGFLPTGRRRSCRFAKLLGVGPLGPTFSFIL
jgi:hypothetical protein